MSRSTKVAIVKRLRLDNVASWDPEYIGGHHGYQQDPDEGGKWWEEQEPIFIELRGKDIHVSVLDEEPLFILERRKAVAGIRAALRGRPQEIPGSRYHSRQTIVVRLAAKGGAKAPLLVKAPCGQWNRISRAAANKLPDLIAAL